PLASRPPPCALPSFPTRRSSDLPLQAVERQTYAQGHAGIIVVVRAGALVIAQFLGSDAGFGRELVRIKAQREAPVVIALGLVGGDRKSTRLNSSHVKISYAVFCL